MSLNEYMRRKAQIEHLEQEAESPWRDGLTDREKRDLERLKRTQDFANRNPSCPNPSDYSEYY